MWAVYKKELKSYFLSPIGYVVIGILLFVFTVFFYLTAMGGVNFGGLFYNTAAYGLIITVPILTMRMFSEERKNGTEQLILTSPVSMVGVVLGKFLAAMFVMFVATVATFMYFGIVSYFANPNIVVFLVMILGFLLVSGAAISIGMFASSLTESQLIAGIITIAFLILSLFVPQLGEEFKMISIMDFYKHFPSGVISLTEVVGAASFTFMFIAFTIIVMQRRKLVK